MTETKCGGVGCNQPIPPGHHYCEICGWAPKSAVVSETHLCACGCGKPASISNAMNGKGKWWTSDCWRRQGDFKLPDKDTMDRRMTQLRDLLQKKA